MITVTKQLRTETAHRLMDYDGRCSHIHGHSYLWEVEATSAEMSANGMILDFKDLKRAMNAVLDKYDHALVLRKDDPLIEVLGEYGTSTSEVFEGTNGEPPRMFIWDQNPTAEVFASFAAEAIQDWLDNHYTDPGIQVVSVKCWETATSFALWKRGSSDS